MGREPERERRRCPECRGVDSFPVGWSLSAECLRCRRAVVFVPVGLCLCGCGESLDGGPRRRKDAVYVSGACRQRARKARKARAAEPSLEG